MQPLANRRRALAMSTRAGQHRHADRLDRLDLGVDERQHDVEIVNHQVEDDVDVEAALGKRAEPVDLDEARIGQQRPRRGDRRIEALGVPDRQDSAAASRPRRSSRRLRRAMRAIGFSTSTGMPASRNGSAMSAVQLGRHRDRHRVDAARARRDSRTAAASGAPPRSPRARARLVSTTATSSTPGSDDRIRA